MPDDISLSGILHLAGGGIAFALLVAACIAVGRRASRAGEGGWSRFSWVTGLFFLVAFGLVASGGDVPVANELLTVAIRAVLDLDDVARQPGALGPYGCSR